MDQGSSTSALGKGVIEKSQGEDREGGELIILYDPKEGHQNLSDWDQFNWVSVSASISGTISK